VLAVEVKGLAIVALGQHFAPDGQELARQFIALGVRQEQAVAFQLLGVATGDQVDQQAAA